MSNPLLPLTPASLRIFSFHAPPLGDPAIAALNVLHYHLGAEAARVIVRCAADSNKTGTREKAKGRQAGSKGRLKSQAWNRPETHGSGLGPSHWQNDSSPDSVAITVFSP